MTIWLLNAIISVIHDIVKRGECNDSRTTDFLSFGRKENDASGVLQTNRDCNDYNQRLEKEEHESGIREDHAGVCEDSDRGKAVDYMVIPQGTEERELLELFNEMQWLERTRLLEYAKKLSEKKNSPYDSQGKKAMKKIAEFCDVEIYMDEEFSGSPAVDVNYLDDDVQGSIDLEQGVIKGDFSKYVLPVIEAWLIEHREMLMEMWKAKKIGLIPAWE